MKTYVTLISLFFGSLILYGQSAISIKNLQTPALDETSGLIFYNNNLITHNDGGNNPNLYEIDINTGNIKRTVVVSNATNVDWEDIAQDASYIYVGDIGNNNGNRTDLKIYKISKADYSDADDTVTAEIINYSYSNQTDFTLNTNNNNWDAEGLISYGNNLLVFTKNWADKKVNVYAIPKISGNHSAALISSYDVKGLITGAEVSSTEDKIFLTGYNINPFEAPFMYTIHNIPNNSLDVFSGIVSAKISMIVSLWHQVEAIALFEITANKHRLYISNERNVVFPAKLWVIEIDNATLNSPTITPEPSFKMYPNPSKNLLQFNKIVDEVIIYDLSGKLINTFYLVEQLSLKNLQKGVYVIHAKVNDTKFVEKIIKN